MKKLLIELVKENLQLIKEIEALKEQIEKSKESKDVVFKISGKDLIGILERSKNKPSSQEMSDMMDAYKAKSEAKEPEPFI